MYYSIDDIITDGQKLPCNFEITVPGLGYLQGAVGEDLKEQTKLELPLWLAELLATSVISEDSDKAFVTLLPPQIFASRVINALKTNPQSVDLRMQSNVFYYFSERWLALFNDEDLGETIIETLVRRAAEISDYAHNHNQLAGDIEFKQKLDIFERDLFKIAHDSSKNMKKWLASKD